MAYHTFAITFRPADGITDDQITALDAWFHKACDYHAAVTEKLGRERHLHAALFLSKTTTRSNLHNRIFAIKGIDGTLTAVEKSVFRKGTKIMYNDDFATGYMAKMDDTVEVSNTIPPDFEVLQAYYPDKDDARAERKFVGSIWYVNMERLWQADAGQSWFTRFVSKTNVEAFMHDCMFNRRVIEVIEDPRRRAYKRDALVDFLYKHPPARAPLDRSKTRCENCQMAFQYQLSR